MPDTQNALTFEDILLLIKRSAKELSSFSEAVCRQDVNVMLPKLVEAVSKIGSKPATRPPMSEVYMLQWEEFSADKRDQMDRSAVQYLCWEPEVALHKKFLDYVQKSQFELNPRALQGLVRSCHSKWAAPLAQSKTVAWIRNHVWAYNGINRVLAKWKSDADVVLGANGPVSLAERLVASENVLQQHIEDWYLDGQSRFVNQMVVAATERCRARITDKRVRQLLFDQILPWGGWPLTDFKREIGKLILHPELQRIQDRLQIFVLSDKRLGDPRLPAARRNWAEVPTAAVNRLLEFLCRDDILFFFEHVYPTGADRHHRRDFWLQYVGRCTASRPLLCRNDRIRLKSELSRENMKVGHFGRLRAADNSAFLLIFGDVTVVEFSKVGRCYIYTTDNFQKIVGDYWTHSEYTEAKLKDEKRCITRIRHLNTTNIDWRDDTRRILAQHGIRPGRTS